MFPYPHSLVASERLRHGTVFRAPSFCARADKEKCRAFYASVQAAPGFHVCPYGYSAFVSRDQGVPIFSGLKIEGQFDRAKVRGRHEDAFGPMLPQKHFMESVASISESLKGISGGVARKDGATSSAMEEQWLDAAQSLAHEVRNFNRDIKAAAEDINRVIESRHDYHLIEEKGQTIFALSSLISTRIAALDLAGTRSYSHNQTWTSQVVHTKFYKAMKCLRAWALRRERKTIVLSGGSFCELNMLPVFDLLPFILLENAIKYSPPERQIDVLFEEANGFLYVKTDSIGPYASPEEVARFGKVRTRSRYAREVDTTGTGRGLLLAARIADMHNVSLSFSSGEPTEKMNGRPYSKFEARLACPVKLIRKL